MILLVHMLFGAAIGSLVENAPLAIILALAGHYFLDVFPHIEYLNGVEDSIKKLQQDHWKKSTIKIIKVLLDFCLGMLLIFLFSKNHPIIYVCAFVAIVPDALTVIHSLFPNIGLKLHHYIHGTTIHYLTKQKNFPIFWKISTQVLAVIASVMLLKI